MARAIRKRYAGWSQAILRASSPASAIHAVDAAMADPSGGEPEIARILMRAAATVQPRPTTHAFNTVAMFSLPGHAGRPGKVGGSLPADVGGVPTHISNGSSYSVTQSEAIAALKAGFTTKTANGKNAVWGEWLVDKYVLGKERKEGKEPERLQHLARAVAAVKYANHGFGEVDGGQYQYLHRFKGSAVVVFTDRATGRVRSFFSKIGSSADMFLSRYKKRASNPFRFEAQ